MNQFKEGMAVITIGKLNEVKKGTIKSVYEDLGYAVVDFGNDNLAKVPFDEIGILSDTEAVEENKSEEPDKESIKVTSWDGTKVITKDQFMDKVIYITSPEYLLNEKKIDADQRLVMMKWLSVVCVGIKITEKLFGDNEEIEISKEQLLEVIKESCSPTEIAKSIDNKMSVIEVFPISILSTCLLKEIVHMLFEDNGEND